MAIASKCICGHSANYCNDSVKECMKRIDLSFSYIRPETSEVLKQLQDQITALQSSLKDTTELWKSQMAMNLKLNQELNELNGQNVNLKSSLKEKEAEIKSLNYGLQKQNNKLEELKAESERLKRLVPDHPKEMP